MKRQAELEKLYIDEQGDGNPVVIFCHGLTNDSINCPLLNESVDLIRANSGTTVRFDFRGSGRSQGEFAEKTISLMLEDLAQVRSRYRSRPVAFWGRSVGGSVAILHAADSAPVGMFLMSPVLDLQGTFLKFQDEHSDFTAMPRRHWRSWVKGDFKLPARFFEELAAYDRRLTSGVSVDNAIVVQGLQDRKVDPLHNRESFRVVLPNSELRINEEAGHDFEGAEEWVLGELAEWWGGLRSRLGES